MLLAEMEKNSRRHFLILSRTLCRLPFTCSPQSNPTFSNKLDVRFRRRSYESGSSERKSLRARTYTQSGSYTTAIHLKNLIVDGSVLIPDLRA